MIIENNGKFNLKVYDEGYVFLTELDDNLNWKICEYNTREEAEKVLEEFNKFKAWAAE